MLRNCHIRLLIKNSGISQKSFKTKLVYTFCSVHMFFLTYFIFAEYSLVIICSSHDEEKNPMISKLHLYRRPHGISADLATYREYLKTHLINKTQPSYEQVQLMGSGNASVVDCDRYIIIICFTQCTYVLIGLSTHPFCTTEALEMNRTAHRVFPALYESPQAV